MPTKIRLTRTGKKNQPSYRIIVCDSNKPRDGKYLDLLGTYDPANKDEKKKVKVNMEKVEHWLKKGAQKTETVSRLLKNLIS